MIAVTLDGATAYEFTPYAATSASGWTIQFWVNGSASGNVLRDHDFWGTWVGYFAQSIRMWSAAGEHPSTYVQPVDTWTQYTFTYDGVDELIISVNGGAHTDTHNGVTFFQPPEIGALGAQYGPGGLENFTTGAVDDLRIFDGVLTPAEIAANWNVYVDSAIDARVDHLFDFENDTVDQIDPTDGTSVGALNLTGTWAHEPGIVPDPGPGPGPAPADGAAGMIAMCM
jgi:hypothetical protein